MMSRFLSLTDPYSLNHPRRFPSFMTFIIRYSHGFIHSSPLPLPFHPFSSIGTGDVYARELCLRTC